MSAAQALLPALREELRLYDGPQDWSGARSYLLYDPNVHRHLRIGQRAFDILALWGSITIPQMQQRFLDRYGEPLQEQELAALVDFAQSNNLTQASDPASLETLHRRTRRGLLTEIVHRYLFFRVPLFQPEKTLSAFYPLVAPLFSYLALGIWLVLFSLALFLVSRHWDVFLGTFLDFLTLEGALIYGGSLIVIKACHELGHAFAAHRYGAKVPVIGVAFIVLFPVLYTDTTDAYRLRSRAQRFVVNTAGIAVELWIAVLASLLWAILPEGPWRSVAFVAASSSWIMSLAVNLNPFMRFDGYYILSDVLNAPNLHQRAFAFGRWKLREWLFDLRHRPPEPVPVAFRQFLIGFAWAIWIYRLFLFIGIALLVYSTFFKLLGVALFFVEILWFIASPVYREVKQWYEMRHEIRRRPRSLTTLTILFAIIAACSVPLPGSVSSVAVLSAARETALYAPREAQVTQVLVERGQEVAAGAPLLLLTSPELENAWALAQKELELLLIQQHRVLADPDRSDERLIIDQKIEAVRTKLTGLAHAREELALRAPFDGIVREMAPGLRAGRFAAPSESLLVLISPERGRIQAMVDEYQLGRIDQSQPAQFIPDDLALDKIEAELLEITPAAVGELPNPVFKSDHDGPAHFEQTGQGKSRIVNSVFLVELQAQNTRVNTLYGEVIGRIQIEAQPRSVFSRIYGRVHMVLIREFSA
ncbi:MAG: HlyD family efflux transporter periplasmic adaptor subunit [Neomegalonema sp.]|nr:HlyD family efflux transporter periplasmic adaptor subunit [Neomegalonema sp.]